MYPASYNYYICSAVTLQYTPSVHWDMILQHRKGTACSVESWRTNKSYFRPIFLVCSSSEHSEKPIHAATNRRRQCPSHRMIPASCLDWTGTSDGCTEASGSLEWTRLDKFILNNKPGSRGREAVKNRKHLLSSRVDRWILWTKWEWIRTLQWMG